MTQEALKMALEALEADELDMVDDGSGNMVFRKEQAIAAIKKALSEPEQEPVAWMFQHDETGRMNYVSNDGIHDPTMFLGMNPRYALVCPLYTIPPQPKEPEQEPVAWEQFYPDIGKPQIAEALAKEKALQDLHDENERLGLYKDAYAEQEPMAWISTGPARMIHWTSDKPAYGDDWVPLYTTSPQRKPLTDEDVERIVREATVGEHGIGYTIARAIEAAHGIKEKNNG